MDATWHIWQITLLQTYIETKDFESEHLYFFIFFSLGKRVGPNRVGPQPGPQKP